MAKIENRKIVATADITLRIVFYIFILGATFFMGKTLMGPILGVSDYSSGLSTPMEFSVPEQGTATFNSNQVVPVKIVGGRGVVQINRPVPNVLLIPFFILNFIFFGLILWIVYSLRKIVQSVRQKNPFTSTNGKRLRIIAFSMVGIELIRGLADLTKMLYLEPRLHFETILIRSDISISLRVIIAGLVILVIAEAFRIGAEITEEQELTV
ncbi:hypothetical protein MGWOODY_Mmi797 [hydrothermal vent metagenome]|uniref:DUF2975 domain-containing protein n=1 Tax=hydrothermal vent metagenome TaxID=652676 RepID=A0A160VG08_9ZZZZ|tara:strand:- start:15 stop:647 length:633 start_codon:yes stop_codon:yes gene_type:complete